MNRITTGVTIVMLVLFTAILEAPYLPASASSGKESKAIFMKSCATCHGPEGKGNGVMSASFPVKPKDFTDCKTMKGMTDKFLFDIIKEGGAATGKSPLMPPWGTAMSENQIKDLVTFIRSLCKK